MALKELRHGELIRKYLTSGCDERVYLNEDGLSSYWLDPFDYKELLHRGSCTCSALHADSARIMDDMLDRNLGDHEVYEAALERQTAELKQLINYDKQDRFDVFYAPSGTDLVYLPLYFAHILYPDKPILNLLSCPEELGSGTLFAVRGQYHGQFNQFEEETPKGSYINSSNKVDVVDLQARSRDGRIVNHTEFIRDQVASHPGHSIVMSSVYGSKSGIEDSLDIIDKIDREDVIWSIDMCQFRHSRKIIHRLLDRNGCVMITGSKFYQAPPFCAALLVSKPFMERLKKGQLNLFSELKQLLSAYDFPKSIREQTGLKFRQNVGLRLRWECSIREMEAFRDYPKEEVRAMVTAWNNFITEQLSADEAFELMPDQNITNSTIISFRIKKDGQYLDHLALKGLYKHIVTRGRLKGFPESRVAIGQPVAYGDRSFLRLAIGSRCIRQFIDRDETEFAIDAAVIELIKSNIHAFAQPEQAPCC